MKLRNWPFNMWFSIYIINIITCHNCQTPSWSHCLGGPQREAQKLNRFHCQFVGALRKDSFNTHLADAGSIMIKNMKTTVEAAQFCVFPPLLGWLENIRYPDQPSPLLAKSLAFFGGKTPLSMDDSREHVAEGSSSQTDHGINTSSSCVWDLGGPILKGLKSVLVLPPVWHHWLGVQVGSGIEVCQNQLPVHRPCHRFPPWKPQTQQAQLAHYSSTHEPPGHWASLLTPFQRQPSHEFIVIVIATLIIYFDIMFISLLWFLVFRINNHNCCFVLISTTDSQS